MQLLHDISLLNAEVLELQEKAKKMPKDQA